MLSAEQADHVVTPAADLFRPALSNCDYAAKPTETILLGNLAWNFGKKLDWDAKAMKWLLLLAGIDIDRCPHCGHHSNAIKLPRQPAAPVPSGQPAIEDSS